MKSKIIFSLEGVLDTKLSSKELFWLLLIISLGMFIYGYSLTNGFIWDDPQHVFNNPRVASWTGLKDIWLTPSRSQYYPLTFSFFWLEHKLWGFHPFGYHVVNLTLHILNALLLFGLLRKTTLRLAGITALLFTIHPIQVETVAWISEQKNLFSLFFFLLAFQAFLNFDEKGRKRDYFKMLLFFIAAILSKSVAVCFATVPLLYVWYKRGSISRHDLFRVFPLFLMGLISAAITIHFESVYTGSEGALSSLNLLEKTLLSGRIFFFYIKQVLFPYQFLFFYPKWNTILSSPLNWIYPVGVFVLYTVFFKNRRQLGRGLFVLLCFYGISIFPALGFFDVFPMQISYVADHFSYLSMPALLLLACLLGRLFLKKIRTFLSKRSWSPSPFLKKSVVLAFIVYLSLSSLSLTLNYKDEPTLWIRLISQNPTASMPFNNLAVFLAPSDISIALFEKAVEIDPRFALAHRNLGKEFRRKGLFEKAVNSYLQAMAVSQEVGMQISCCYFIGEIYFSQNKLKEAAFYLEKTIPLLKGLEYKKQKRLLVEMKIFDLPSEVSPVNILGATYLRSKRAPEAVGVFQYAISLDPENVESHQGLGAAYMNLGETRKALLAFQEAVRLAPKNETTRKNLEIVQTIFKKKTAKN